MTPAHRRSTYEPCIGGGSDDVFRRNSPHPGEAPPQGGPLVRTPTPLTPGAGQGKTSRDTPPGGHAFTGGRRLVHDTDSEDIRDLERLLRPCPFFGREDYGGGAMAGIGNPHRPTTGEDEITFANERPQHRVNGGESPGGQLGRPLGWWRPAPRSPPSAPRTDGKGPPSAGTPNARRSGSSSAASVSLRTCSGNWSSILTRCAISPTVWNKGWNRQSRR
jgi:hypothetical protein